MICLTLRRNLLSHVDRITRHSATCGAYRIAIDSSSEFQHSLGAFTGVYQRFAPFVAIRAAGVVLYRHSIILLAL